MELQLQKSDNQIQPFDKDQLEQRIVTHEAYNEEVGYYEWFVLETFDKHYKITPNEKEQIQRLMETAKFIELGDEMIAVHQIKRIYKDRRDFGPRPGEA